MFNKWDTEVKRTKLTYKGAKVCPHKFRREDAPRFREGSENIEKDLHSMYAQGKPCGYSYAISIC